MEAAIAPWLQTATIALSHIELSLPVLYSVIKYALIFSTPAHFAVFSNYEFNLPASSGQMDYQEDTKTLPNFP
jgi:hypothetical protein